MSHLSLALLGPFQAWNAGGSQQTFRTVKERALLSYLVVEHSRAHRRNALAAIFWPERSEAVARNNLRQALFGLRQVIGEAHFGAIFTVTGEDVRVTVSDQFWLDTVAYQVHLQAAQRHDHADRKACPYCLQHLRDAVELYRGPFLENVSLEKNPTFNEWRDAQRERFHHLQLQALDRLIEEFSSLGDYVSAAGYAASLVRLDDTNEAAYRRLMTCLARQGRSAEAVDWHAACRRRLAQRGRQPSAETEALAVQIRAGHFETGIGQAAVDHNLPEMLTPLVGREMELARLAQLLAEPACRLVTIVGLGGVGKTRLAISAARMSLHAYPDGIYFVPLEGVTDPETMLAAIARTIGLVPDTQQETRSVLLSFLRLKTFLLVLDNFDHLQESKGMLLEILQAAPYGKLLVTSRERLRLQIEYLLELDGLSYPRDGNGMVEKTQAEAVQDAPAQSFAAVQLFLERAGRARSGGMPSGNGARPENLDAQELAAVVQICRRLHGLPLGIELAASLARDYRFAEIDQEVQRSIDFLQASFADLPERQRSLRISFEYSWDLLPESERVVLSMLSIFPASFTAEAAQVVAGAAMPWLMRLDDRSLVRRVAFGRYDLHPLIRQYATQKLRQYSRRIADQALQQHAEFFCGFMAARERDLQGGRQPEALAEIGADLDNILSAWQWAVERRAVGLLRGAAFALMFFLDARGRWREGADLFDGAVQNLQGGEDLPEANIVLGVLNSYLGWFHCRLARYDSAQVCLGRSLELLSEREAERERAFAHFATGFLATWMGRYRDGWLHLSTSRSLAERIDDRWGVAWSAQVQAEIAFESGQAGLQDEPFLQTLALFEALGEQRGTARALNYLGNIALATGRMADARAYYERLVLIMEKLGDVWGAASGYSKMGQLVAAGGDVAQSLRLHRRSLQMYQKMGDQRRSAIAMREIAEASAALGMQPAAEAYFRDALEIAARLQNAALAQDVLTGLAVVLAGAQRSADASALLAIVLAGPTKPEQLTANRAARLLESLDSAAGQLAPGAADLWQTVDDFLRGGVRL